MTITVTHQKVNSIADDPTVQAAGGVVPSDWNANHTVVVTGLDNVPIGATTPSTGAFTTLSSTGNTTLGDSSSDTVLINGPVGLGASPIAWSKLHITGLVPSSSLQSYVVNNTATIPSTSTLEISGFSTALSTQEAAFSVSQVNHFDARSFTLGSGSSATTQNGFIAGADLTAATNNYGFYSLIASAANRWNFYAGGTAPNYFAGNTTFNTGLTANGTINFSALSASTALALDASKNVVSVTNTGSGNNVLATSPTLVTPNLGTPSAATLTNATGLPVSTGISGLGTGVATFLATPSSANLASAITDETGSGALVFATSPTLVTPNLGTPSAATLTNATGLPVSTGISGLGTGVATFLATPSSANLASAITDETGSGALVFATSPTLVTPNLGTPSAATLTNATGLPVSTGVSGLGTGVATALAVNTGTAGAFLVNGDALGTPSSGTVTNLTGTASININGTVGATTPSTGAFTTLSSTGNTTLGDSSSDTVTINGTVQPGVIISGSSAGNALRITQTGAGNAFVVEDDTNPDASPFVVDSIGNVGVGASPSAAAKISVSGASPVSSASGQGIFANNSVPTALTSQFVSFYSYPTTAASATPNQIFHFYANQATLGASSTITQQLGYLAESTLTGATNNFGFYSGIASATNRYNFYAGGTAANYFAGNTGIGGLPTTDAFRISGTASGSTFVNGQVIDQTIGSGVTSSYRGLLIRPIMQDAAFTLSTLYHVYVNPQTKPATPTLSNQYGFMAESTLTAATSNYGFFGNIAAASGRWNFYGGGTAANHFSGTLSIGTPSVTYNLEVNKSLTGGVERYQALLSGEIQSDVTTLAVGALVSPSINNSAFTLATYRGFQASSSNISGAATVTNYHGFFQGGVTQSNITNAYGYTSNIASGTGRWNFYAGGTAANYFAGSSTFNAGIIVSGSVALNGSTSGTVTVSTAAAAGTWTLTLPTSAGTNGYVLSTNGAGVTSWVAQSGGGGGGATAGDNIFLANNFGGF